MSKGPDGPAATSFENPRKTGWLHKHGGSGMSSHWKKRWFIVDHHYLFYFKGPNDKKPVGILCLPEYQSCHKADNKESKKANSFILGRGTSDSESGDGAGKNYILHTDSETDMEKWMEAIREEMKPIIGELGFSSSYNKPSTPKPKIDQKAFDEVTAIAAGGPKLTHPTASRPKPRGRRPPKRYAVFHEDDSKDDDSPTITPSPSSSSLSTKPPSASPTTSPANSPRVPKKGNQPSIPLLPTKTPMTPPKPKSSSLERAENSSKPITKPEPPRKVSKEKKESANNPDADSPKLEPKIAPKPSPRPKKPLPVTPVVATTEPALTEVSEKPTAEVKVVPNVRPKPVPPRAKPRTPSISLQNSVENLEAPSSKEGGVQNQAPPQPTPRRSTSPEAEVVYAQPTKKARPVPVPRKPEGPKPALTPDCEDKPARDDGEVVNNKEPVEEIKKEEIDDETTKKEVKEEVAKDEEPVKAQGSEKSEVEAQRNSSLDRVPQKEVAEDNKQEEIVDDKVDKIAEEHKVGNNAISNGVVNTDNERIQLEDRGEPQEKEEKSYEDMNCNKESPKTNGECPEEGQNQFAYVEMSPGEANSTQDKTNEYEPVEVIVNDEEDKNDYEIPQDWNDQTVASARSSGGFVPMALKADLTDEQMAIYDVPPSPRPAILDDRPSSSATGDSITSQSQDAASRSNSVASSSSLSSKNSANSPLLRPRTASQERNSATVVVVANSASNLEQQIETLEVSIEKANSQKSDADNLAELKDSREADTVNKALLQAKEILRLAKEAKDEADQLKKESAGELELAKRERHDASLMKKQAAEILRMAKTKIGKK